MLKQIRILALLVLSLSGVFSVSASASVEGVRVVGDGEVTRVTIWTTQAREADVFLSETPSVQQILVALDGAQDVSGAVQPVAPQTGVSGYGWQRGYLAFSLARPMMVVRKLDLPPSGEEARHRIVLDLTAVSDVRFARAAGQQENAVIRRTATHVEAGNATAEITVASAETLAASAHDVVLVPQETGRYLIVIDPGHGGKDPGAIAADGLQEKAVVLSAAHMLRDMLEEDDRYRVRLTRDDDIFIELEDRVSLAREWGADLFISLHADAAANPDVSGASVYTISERGEARIDREAEKNDWHMPIEDGVPEDVSGILEELLKRETRSNSGVFAELLLPELAEAGPVVRNTHRNAGFFVLLAPDVPAVLLEIGFLTNTTDAQRLASAQGKRRSMGAVRDAINRYFDRQDVIFAEN